MVRVLNDQVIPINGNNTFYNKNVNTVIKFMSGEENLLTQKKYQLLQNGTFRMNSFSKLCYMCTKIRLGRYKATC